MRAKAGLGVIELIEKIYKNNYMAICDNCGTGQECDNWADVMEFMREEGWKKKLVDGEWKHYCPECNYSIIAGGTGFDN